MGIYYASSELQLLADIRLHVWVIVWEFRLVSVTSTMLLLMKPDAQ